MTYLQSKEGFSQFFFHHVTFIFIKLVFFELELSSHFFHQVTTVQIIGAQIPIGANSRAAAKVQLLPLDLGRPGWDPAGPVHLYVGGEAGIFGR